MPQPPTQQQTLHLTLDGGIDQRVYERHVPTTELLDAVNVRFNKTGGADKRPGCAAYAASPTAGTGKLLTHRNELLLADGHSMCTATATSGSATFLVKDKYPEAMPSSDWITASSSTSLSLPDIAYSSANGGYFVYAWGSGGDALGFAFGDIYVTVQDATTGAELCAGVRLSDGTAASYGVRLVTLGTTVYALWDMPASSKIKWSKFDPVTATWTAAADLVTDIATNCAFDACATTTKIYIVYRNTANATVLKSFNASMALQATGTSSETHTNTKGFGIHGSDADYIWYSYDYATGGSTLAWTGAFTANLVTETLTPIRIYTQVTSVDQVIRTVPVRYSSTRAAVLLSTWTGAGGASLMTATVDISSTLVVDPTNRRSYWTTMGSRPFVASTSPLRVMAWVYTGGARYDFPSGPEQPLQWTYTLVDLGVEDTTTTDLPPRPVCWEANRFAESEGAGLPSSCVQVGNAWYAAAITLKTSQSLGLLRVKADFASPAAFASAQLGQTLHIAPGWVWDGARLFEQGFCYWPQKPSTPAFSIAAGGHLVPGSTYRRRIVYEWTDGEGNVHRSQPSDILEFTVTAGNDTATYTVPNLCLTTRSDAASQFRPAVSIVVYGTQPTDIDGFTYYRLFDLPATPSNNVLAESTTIVDQGNVLLTRQPELYTLGGALPNVQPRGCTAMVTYRNRLWIAYGNTVNYSKAYVTGECVSFTDSFELPLEETGDITAMWVMDDRLFISTASRIYWLQADGPADDGTQNDVGTPNRIATDLGCIEPRSLVVTPLGTIYQSAVSLELLDRGLQVAAEPFGYKVRTELANYPTVTGAIVHPSGGYFVVSVNNAAGDAGERLVHDYTQGRWSRDSMLGGKAILSTAVLSGIVYFLTSDGNVYRELPSTDSAAYLDAGAWVTMSVKTAWIHPAGPQGYQWAHRVLWMGDKSSNHALTIQSFVDYATSADRTWSVTSAQINSFPIPQYSIDPLNQRCMAVSFVVSDGAPTGAPGTGKGSMFAALAVDVETAGNSWELPAVQKG